MKKQATVAAAVFANKVVQYLKKTATRGLVFLMGVISWHLGDFVIGSVCDASHADEHCERTGEPVQESRRTHDDSSDTQPRGPDETWIPLDSVCIEHAEGGLPLYAHSTDIPDGIGCRSRRSTASRNFGHV